MRDMIKYTATKKTMQKFNRNKYTPSSETMREISQQVANNKRLAKWVKKHNEVKQCKIQ